MSTLLNAQWYRSIGRLQIRRLPIESNAQAIMVTCSSSILVSTTIRQDNDAYRTDSVQRIYCLSAKHKQQDSKSGNYRELTESSPKAQRKLTESSPKAHSTG